MTRRQQAPASELKDVSLQDLLGLHAGIMDGRVSPLMGYLDAPFFAHIDRRGESGSVSDLSISGGSVCADGFLVDVPFTLQWPPMAVREALYRARRGAPRASRSVARL